MIVYLFYILISPLIWVALLSFGLLSKKIRKHVFNQYRSYKNIRHILRENKKSVAVFHAASAGEYEQLKPVIEKINRDKYLVILTFFSPTIYDKISESGSLKEFCYHPFDFLWSAFYFFHLLQPEYYVVTRHDIWPNHLIAARCLKVKRFLINANLYDDSYRLKPVLKYFNKMVYAQFNLVLTGSTRLADNLHQLIDAEKIVVTGDTRFDQVIQRKSRYHGRLLPEIYVNTDNIIFGSIISSDFNIIFNTLAEYLPEGSTSLQEKNQKLILVPHESDESLLKEFEKKVHNLHLSCDRYSQLAPESAPDVLIIDSVGILADLYYHCFFAYVGAGFSAGVHSVIEPAVHGCIVSYGPNINILDEAVSMSEQHVGQIVRSESEFLDLLHSVENISIRKKLQKKTFQFVHDHPVSSPSIIDTIFKY